MRKNKGTIKNRRCFVKKCITDPAFIDDYIKNLTKLKECPKTGDRVAIIAEALFLSEETVWKDYIE